MCVTYLLCVLTALVPGLDNESLDVKKYVIDEGIWLTDTLQLFSSPELGLKSRLFFEYRAHDNNFMLGWLQQQHLEIWGKLVWKSIPPQKHFENVVSKLMLNNNFLKKNWLALFLTHPKKMIRQVSFTPLVIISSRDTGLLCRSRPTPELWSSS